MVFLFAPEYTFQGYGFYPGEYLVLHSYSEFAAFHTADAKYAIQVNGSIWLLASGVRYCYKNGQFSLNA